MATTNKILRLVRGAAHTVEIHFIDENGGVEDLTGASSARMAITEELGAAPTLTKSGGAITASPTVAKVSFDFTTANTTLLTKATYIAQLEITFAGGPCVSEDFYVEVENNIFAGI